MIILSTGNVHSSGSPSDAAFVGEPSKFFSRPEEISRIRPARRSCIRPSLCGKNDQPVRRKMNGRNSLKKHAEGRSVAVKLNPITFALVPALIAVLFSGASYGFKQTDLDKLQATKQCAFCDLKAASLGEASLSGTRLSGAMMSDADLTAADLSQGNLRNAMLARANLSRANLSGADLSRADLTRARLSEAKLANAKLVGAELSKADFSDADLSKADLSGADLTGANLTRANLSGAILSGARWVDGVRCSADSTETCTKQREPPSTGGMF